MGRIGKNGMKYMHTAVFHSVSHPVSSTLHTADFHSVSHPVSTFEGQTQSCKFNQNHFFFKDLRFWLIFSVLSSKYIWSQKGILLCINCQ